MFYLITKRKIQAKQIKRADMRNQAKYDIGKIRNWHRKKINITDKKKKTQVKLKSNLKL